MQSTKSASSMALRISPSPDCCDDMEPLASTTPAVPPGLRWCTMCCSQAKLALPFGGVPNFHRTSFFSLSAAPIRHIERRIGQNEVELLVTKGVVMEAAGFLPLNVRRRCRAQPCSSWPDAMWCGSFPGHKWRCCQCARRVLRRTLPIARTYRLSRNTDRRPGPCRVSNISTRSRTT